MQTGGVATKQSSTGGAGGNGAVTINQLGSVLNYPTKRITMHMGENYQINQDLLSYVKLNEIQTIDLSVGNIRYQLDYGTAVEITPDGNIQATGIGTSKIKITDIDNEYSTYIVIDVIEEKTKAKIESGTDFTIALKGNGTVWSYGKNSNGELGIDSKINSNEPVQVIKEDGGALENIIDIGAGNTGSIAVDENGEVYIWGLCYENLVGQNILKAKKLENISNIAKVSCKGDTFYAVDKEGTGYVWGKGYSEQVRIQTDIKIIDIDGGIILGEDGRAYIVSNPNQAIPYLNGLLDISSGQDHNQYTTLEGHVYSMGTRRNRSIRK